MIIYKSIEIKWMITGYSNYGFGTDKSLYNLKTGRKLNQSYNNGSIGYWFNRKFISLKSLKHLIYKPKKQIVPF